MKQWTGTEQEWEDLCDGCGKCCHILSGFACPAFDTETRRCTSYETRLSTQVCYKLTPETVEWLRDVGTLPETCAYVCWLEDRDPPEVIEPAKFKPFTSGSPLFQATFILGRRKFLETHRGIKPED